MSRRARKQPKPPKDMNPEELLEAYENALQSSRSFEEGDEVTAQQREFFREMANLKGELLRRLRTA